MQVPEREISRDCFAHLLALYPGECATRRVADMYWNR